MKQAKGVLVKPEVQKLPGLAPGTSWTLSARVQLTARAKPKSTLSLTGTAPGATTATGSLVVKLKRVPPTPQGKRREAASTRFPPGIPRLAEDGFEPGATRFSGECSIN
ncbi:MAG TPA: hypothetical protein VHB53_04605 [Solirubrobacterales bacterium]|nr:hypothetical protein [Solirubrobacterales bacterium]